MVVPAVTVIPPGLSPGDTYQLIFVTRDRSTMNALSDDLSAYDAYVQGEADAADIGIGSSLFGFNVTWTAIVTNDDTVLGTRAALQARANVTGPVYTLDGVLVANDANELFPTGSDVIQNPVWIDESGVAVTAANHEAWTVVGTTANTRTGRVADTSSNPILNSQWYSFNVNANDATNWHFYAISQVLTTAEPASLALLGLGLVAIGFRRRRAP